MPVNEEELPVPPDEEDVLAPPDGPPDEEDLVPPDEPPWEEEPLEPPDEDELLEPPEEDGLPERPEEEDLPEELRGSPDEYVDEFRGDRLQTYYRANPDCAVLAFEVYAEAARHMSVGEWRAAVVLASSAIEACLRDAILKPLVCGLVHNEHLADVVAHHALAHPSFDRVQELVFGVLKVHGETDLKTYARERARKPLWREIGEVRGARNRVVHGAERTDRATAEHAVEVASHVLRQLLLRVLHRLGFTLNDTDKRVVFVRHLGGLWGQQLPGGPPE